MSVHLSRAVLSTIIGKPPEDDARPCHCGCPDIGIVTGYARPFKARQCDRCNERGPEADTLEEATRRWNALRDMESGVGGRES